MSDTHFVKVEKGLWDRIIHALETAKWCDHEEVVQVLKEVEATSEVKTIIS